MNFKNISKLLTQGKIGVMPTDTIYGIVGSALSPEVVEEIYLLRKRSLDKPFIILISEISDLQKFGIQLTEKQRNFLTSNWPNPVSVVLPVLDEKYQYLHRGKKSLAFRMPKDEKLLEILKVVGPLVGPSANIEGETPAKNIEEAKKYFGDRVSFYLDDGIKSSSPSTLVNFTNDSPKILRQGNFKI